MCKYKLKKVVQQMSSVSIDGKSDGFGAQYQAKLSGIALARQQGRCYCHTPFVEMEHLEDETVLSMEAFGGLRSDPCCDPLNTETIPFAQEVHYASDPSTYYTDNVRQYLRQLYDSNTKEKKDNCDVIIHARRGDQKNGDPRFTSDARIIKTVEKAKEWFPTEQICLFSEGKAEDFHFVKGVDLHLNGSVRDTFHSMVSAPHLVVADSSFSYTAALLNENDVIVTNSDWWHKPLSHWRTMRL